MKPVEMYIIPRPAPRVRKPLISVTRNPILGTTFVLRSPLSRRWIANVTIAPLNGSGAMAPVLTLILAIVALLTMGCANPSAPVQDAPTATVTPLDTMGMISTRYISAIGTRWADACHYAWTTDATRDSLIVLGKKYTVSARSRYRAFPEPEWLGDTVLEGDVHFYEVKLYRDTKTDSIYIINSCAGIDTLKSQGI